MGRQLKWWLGTVREHEQNFKRLCDTSSPAGKSWLLLSLWRNEASFFTPLFCLYSKVLPKRSSELCLGSPFPIRLWAKWVGLGWVSKFCIFQQCFVKPFCFGGWTGTGAFGHLVGLLEQIVVVNSLCFYHSFAEEAKGNLLNLQPQSNNFAAWHSYILGLAKTR